MHPPSQCFARTGDKNSSKDADPVVGAHVQLCCTGSSGKGGRKVLIWDRKTGFLGYLACSLVFTPLCQHLVEDSPREGQKEVVMSS